MGNQLRKMTLIDSFRVLKGNTRISVIFQPLWGIPYALFNFYLGLYMKAQGITDQQIGELIAIGFISGTIFSLFSGVITDYLGRKKTTLIFDLIAWPLALLIYIFADNYWLFVLAALCNNVTRIVNVSFTLMMVEDATNEERKAAFTLSNIITIASGVVVPCAGVLVGKVGVIPAERSLLALAVVSMTVMAFWRNRYYVETQIGSEILRENQHQKVITSPRLNLFGNTFAYLKRKPSALVAMVISVLFNVYLPIGTISSLYFAPYLTECLKQSETLISFLGVANSLTMLLVLVLILPRLQPGLLPLMVGLVFQLFALVSLILVPPGNFWPLIIVIVCYALGFGLFRPLVDALFADITEGKERAGLYGLNNTITSIMSALAGFYSGRLYQANPVSIYYFSGVILLFCTIGLFIYGFLEKKPMVPRIILPWRKRIPLSGREYD